VVVVVVNIEALERFELSTARIESPLAHQSAQSHTNRYNGRGGWIQTTDLLDQNQLLYQLSYTPLIKECEMFTYPLAPQVANPG
jgi:hypothetical protein